MHHYFLEILFGIGFGPDLAKVRNGKQFFVFCLFSYGFFWLFWSFLAYDFKA